ncbi:MAG: hypothetical protein AB4042_05320 [Leptolyngbyaceae cyanobacterium]
MLLVVILFNFALACHAISTYALSLSDIRDKAKESSHLVKSVAHLGKNAAGVALSKSSQIADTAVAIGKEGAEVVLSASSQAVGTAVSVGKEGADVAFSKSSQMIDTAIEVGQKGAEMTFSTGSQVASTAIEMGKGGAEMVVSTGSLAMSTAMDVGQTTLHAVADSGQTVASTVSTAGKVTGQETVQAFVSAKQGTEYAVDAIAQQLTTQYQENVVPILAEVIQEIDLEELEEEFELVQLDYPDFDTSALVALFIQLKTSQASVVGQNWPHTVRLLVEMVYQVAQSYGFDIKEIERQREMLQFAAAGLGSSQVARGSVWLLSMATKQIPIFGDWGGDELVEWGSDRLTTLMMFKALGAYASHQYHLMSSI